MKFSKRFEEDFNLYWRLKDTFSFTPYDPLKGRKPTKATSEMSPKLAFFKWDTHGELYKIEKFEELLQVITCKASINFHIKTYAQDRALGWLGFENLLGIQKEFDLPQWFIEAVEKQKVRYYPSNLIPAPWNV